MVSEKLIRYRVTSTKPNEQPVQLSGQTITPAEYVQVMIAQIRQNVIRELDKRDLIFGCTVGRLSMETEPWEGYAPPNATIREEPG